MLVNLGNGKVFLMHITCKSKSNCHLGADSRLESNQRQESRASRSRYQKVTISIVIPSLMRVQWKPVNPVTKGPQKSTYVQDWTQVLFNQYFIFDRIECMCFVDFLPARTLCGAYHKEFESH